MLVVAKSRIRRRKPWAWDQVVWNVECDVLWFVAWWLETIAFVCEIWSLESVGDVIISTC